MECRSDTACHANGLPNLYHISVLDGIRPANPLGLCWHLDGSG